MSIRTTSRPPMAMRTPPSPVVRGLRVGADHREEERQVLLLLLREVAERYIRHRRRRGRQPGRPVQGRRPTAGHSHDGSVTVGQAIDPSIFTDPNTGKSYILYGNGSPAIAELNDDMVSIKPVR